MKKTILFLFALLWVSGATMAQQAQVERRSKIPFAYKDFKDGSMMDFYNFLVNDLHVKMPKIKKKTIKDFYMDHTYADAALGVKYGDSNDKHKTIHKSKGEEYDNVFVVLKEEDDIEFLLTPDLNGNNAHRVYYVAASRAIKRLFINVPTLSAENRIKFEGKPINIS